MRRTLRLLSAGSVAAALSGAGIVSFALSPAHADTFAVADVVVYRVGSGGSLSNAAAPVFLDTYATDTTGAPASSVAVPTADSGAQHALTATGLSRSEGRLSTSPDGSLVSFTGYDAPVGTVGPVQSYVDSKNQNVSFAGSLTASDPSSVARVVGLLDGAGAVDTSTAVTGAAVPHIVRSAATVNGTTLWLGGSDGGVLTTSRGASTAAETLNATGLDTNSLQVAGSQLLAGGADDGAPDKRVVTVGTGTPTSGADLTGLAGAPTGLLPGGFAALDLTAQGLGTTGLDTIYVANAAEKGGAIDKLTFDGSTWNKQGSVSLNGVLAVAAKQTGTQVVLIATTQTGLWTLGETDATATGFTPTAPAQIASAPAGSEFRGVTIAPTGDALAKPTVSVTSPTQGAHVAANVTTLTVTGTASALRGLSGVSVALDAGTPVAATLSGSSWTAHLPLTGVAVGSHTVTATASDTGTPAATASAAITVVRDPYPSLSISAPTAGQHVSYLTTALAVKGSASAVRGIASVTVAVDKGAAAAATLSGTSWSRTINPSTLAVGTHTLTVRAIEKTSGATTTLTRSFVRDPVPAGALGPRLWSFLNSKVTRSSGWTTITYTASPDHRGLRGTGTPYVRFISYGRGLDLHFQRRPDAGKVRVTIDGKPYVYDLYSSTTGDLVKAFRGLAAGKHTVTVQALHQRSSASRGYLVTLGFLRVYL